MYTSFFGFREKPFSLVPNPSYLFLSRQHENALTYLEYGLSENIGFVMLTGDIGTGKTTLLRHMLNTAGPLFNAAVLFNTSLASGDLIPLILERFGIRAPAGTGRVQALESLNRFLIEKFADGQKTLLIIDEAQNLSDAALEEVRMLSNLQTDHELLLHIMIIGQPELRQKIQSPALRQFAQRIAASYHLSAMDAEETRAYIIHRMEKAGGRKETFTRAALEKIFDISKGVPRKINLLCDAALVYAYADGAATVDVDTIAQVVRDKGGIGLVSGENPGPSPRSQTPDNRLSQLETEIAGLNKKVDLILDLLKTPVRLKDPV